MWGWALSVALAEDWAALRSEEGWDSVYDKEVEIGEVVVFRKEIEGMGCLRAEAWSTQSPEALLGVLWDVESAPSWSSNKLLVSEVLEPGDDRMVFWQQVDVPGWTLIHDRFWVLAVDAIREPGKAGFRWSRAEASAWPVVTATAQAFDRNAKEVPLMWGEWLFLAEEDGTRVVWRGCQDVGGALPLWLQVWAAKRSLPAAVEDLVHAAEKRG